jgi:predicted transposase/invertase (TIGR01784 family)
MAKKKKEDGVKGLPSVYMNILTDFGFKKVFSDKQLLIHFLNDILPDAQVADIQYSPTELAEWEERKAVVDLLCTNQKGEYILVEVQRAKQDFFADRALFYASCLVRKQAPVGEWNYELKAVYVVSILDFELSENLHADGKQIFQHVSLIDERTHKRFSDKLRLVFIQLTNFDKPYEQLETNVDRWLFFLKNLGRLESRPADIRGQIFERLFRIAQINKLTIEDMEKYKKSITEYNDVKNCMAYAKKEGMQIGRSEGMQIGRSEGLQIGKIEGMQIGESKVIMLLVSSGMPVDEISSRLKMPVEDVKNILTTSYN